MSKTIFVLAAILFSTFSGAATGEEATARLFYRNNLNFSRTYEVSVRNDEVFVSGRKLASESVILHHDALRAAFSVSPRPPSRACDAGSYDHEVVRGGRATVEKGCLGDARFGVLIRAFARLNKGY